MNKWFVSVEYVPNIAWDTKIKYIRCLSAIHIYLGILVVCLFILSLIILWVTQPEWLRERCRGERLSRHWKAEASVRESSSLTSKETGWVSESVRGDTLNRLAGNGRSVNIVDNQWEVTGGRREEKVGESLRGGLANTLNILPRSTPLPHCPDVCLPFRTFLALLCSPKPHCQSGPTVFYILWKRLRSWVMGPNVGVNHSEDSHSCFQSLSGFWEVTLTLSCPREFQHNSLLSQPQWSSLKGLCSSETP